MFPEIWNFGLSNFISGFLLSFHHLYQELFGTENPDFPAGKSGIPGPTFEGSKVGPRYVRAGLPKVIGTPTVESM